ncbi:hypothetical protein GCM10020229_24100 [Kitasatospora albolonga]
MALDQAYLSRCPYVYRVRCENDGASRRVWIGTQTMARPTEWVPIEECTWDDDGLVTPAASRILENRKSPVGRPTGLSEKPATAVYGQYSARVATFVRGLEAARRSGTVEHVRRLCAAGADFVQTLQATDHTVAAAALDEARQWLATHEEYQRQVFQDLANAIRERRSWDIRSGLPLAASLTRRGSSPAEQRVLSAARSYLRERDHTDKGGAVPRSNSRPVHVAARPRSTSQKQNEAGTQARRMLRRLRREGDLLAPDELSRLVAALLSASDAAERALSDKDYKAVDAWVTKVAYMRRAERGQRPAARTVSAYVRQVRPQEPGLDPLATAVKGILKAAGATGTTLTWGQIMARLPPGVAHPRKLRQQLGILTRVDRSLAPGAPLLSALVTGPDRHMHPGYPELAAAAGRGQFTDDTEARSQWAVEVARFGQKGTR